ncbi:MAG: hypothetical protein IPG34_12855 [Rhodocyclaceae bacterium]|nr:hypothetical protein [Rhodocyclaceae bacterium]
MHRHGAAKPESATRLATAGAMFAERCKSAGVFIHRTAENVEGVFLLKVRPRNVDPDFDDQFQLNDPYGHDSGGDGYIETFVRGSFWANNKGSLSPGSPQYLGYRYVDAVDPKDGKRYRYTGRIDQPWLRDKRYGEWVREFVLDKTPPQTLLRATASPTNISAGGTRVLDRRQFAQGDRPQDQRNHG